MEVSLMLATSHSAKQADEGTLSFTLPSCDPMSYQHAKRDEIVQLQ